MNNEVTFIVPSMFTRFKPLILLLNSIRKYFPQYHLIGCLQQFKDEEVEALKGFPNTTWIVSDKLLGTSTPRILCIKKGLEMGFKYFINLDDDMTLCEKTHYEPIIEFLKNNPNAGLVSGNWRKAFSMIEKLEPTDKFVSQKIVYTGGGLCYRDDVAKLMLDLDFDTICDNTEWSVRSYVNGYDNYRYLGSLCEHKICQKDGRNLYLKLKNRNVRLCDERYVNMVKSKIKDEWLIPLDKDLTKEAHEEHKRNKK